METQDADDEQELARRIASGDRRARDILVKRWAPLVKHWCRRLDVKGRHYPDCYQEGCLALLRAAGDFRPGAGLFFVHARRAVRVAIKGFLRGDRRVANRIDLWATEDLAMVPARTRPAGMDVDRALLGLSEAERSAFRGHRPDGVEGDAAVALRRAAEAKLRIALMGKEAS